MIRNKLHKILGTVKPKDESWVDLMLELDKDGRIDKKTLVRIIGTLLDEYEQKEEKGQSTRKDK